MLTSQLIRVANAYCTATGLSRSRVATIIFNDGKKLDLIAGGADLNTRSYEKAVRWFAENWPEATPWPVAIMARPTPAAADASSGEEAAA